MVGFAGFDRRAVLVGLIGVVGAGVSRWAKLRSFRASQGGAAPAAIAQKPSIESGSGSIKSVAISQIPIGGGGFVTGIDLSRDGQRMVCRTDVANAYLRDAQTPAWTPLFSRQTMVAADYDPLPALNGKADGQGVAGIRVAPSDKNIIVASYYGYIWKSVDGGRSMRRTALPQKRMPSNAGAQRLFNRIIDIHAADPRQILVGTWGDGVWHTQDGGENWSRAALPDAGKSHDGQPGINLVLFDPAGKDRAYVFVTGSGLYRSDHGAAGEFRLIDGGPTTCSNLVAGPDGTIYLCEATANASGRIWRYSPVSGWTPSKPEHEASTIAVDPRQPMRLIGTNPNGYFFTSSDRGASWQSIGAANWHRGAGEVAWTRNLKTLFPAEILFDPTAPGELWIAQGVGVAQASIVSNTISLEDHSAGIEELCAVSALCVPKGKTFLSAWDKSFWRVDDTISYANDFRYPRNPGRDHSPDLVAYGSYMDYAGDDPNFVVGIVAPNADSAPGYSSNGGVSWSVFPGTPGTGWGIGGCIASSTTKNIVLLPSNNGTGVFTLDGGKSWSPIRLDGSQPTARFANSFYVARKNISADKSRPGTFALVYTVVKGAGFGEPLGGVWLTSDGGQTWKQTLAGVIGPSDHDPKSVRARGLEERQFWQCQIDYVPGRSGELVYTPHADYADDQFYWSRDDGANWTELYPAIRNVKAFGFGKSAPGQSRPALYFWGEVDRQKGLFACLDWGASRPALITRFPSPLLAEVSSVTGDPNAFGRIIVGTSCAGWVRIEIRA